mgnify:CR=1 FL=1
MAITRIITPGVTDDAVTSDKINDNIISGKTALGAEPADTDEFLVSDAGVLKRVDYSHIKGGGITEVDRWKMSSQTYSNGNVMSNGWSRDTSLTGAPQGTGLTLSASGSGYFSFPSTGVYHILFGAYIWSSTTTLTYAGVRIDGTTDGFSSNTTELALTYANTSTAQDHSPIFADAIYDVTNTSNNQLRFYNTTAGADMGWYSTRFSVIKLMET